MSIESKYSYYWPQSIYCGADYTLNYSNGEVSLKPHYTVYPGPAALETRQDLESVSEPTKLKVLTRVQWKPKKWKVHPPPLPHLRKELPVPALKPRRPDQSERSWNYAVRKYEWLLRKITRINLSIWNANSRAQAKWRRRTQNFERLVNLQKFGYLTYRKPAKTCGLSRDDHNYYRYQRTDYGRVIYETRYGYSASSKRNAWTGVWDWDVNSVQPCREAFLTTMYVLASPTDWANYLDVSYADDLAADIVKVERRALDRLFVRIKNQDFSLGEMSAERHQSWLMLKDLLTKLKTVISLRGKPTPLVREALTKGKGSLGRYVAKEASNDLLMWQFGLKPLISDIQALLKRDWEVTPEGLLIIARASATSEVTRQYGNTEVIFDYQVRYVVRYSVDNALVASLNQIGLYSDLEIGWELLKWSFVVDWLFNIGQYIDQLNTFAGLKFHSGTKATTKKQMRTYRTTVQTNHGPESVWWQSNKTEIMQVADVTKTRTILTEAPIPNTPVFKNPVSFLHCSELIALLIQRLK